MAVASGNFHQSSVDVWTFKLWVLGSKPQVEVDLYLLKAQKHAVLPALGGIAPNEVIARSEFEVHRQMFTE